jgi:hypothetical protein
MLCLKIIYRLPFQLHHCHQSTRKHSPFQHINKGKRKSPGCLPAALKKTRRYIYCRLAASLNSSCRIYQIFNNPNAQDNEFQMLSTEATNFLRTMNAIAPTTTMPAITMIQIVRLDPCCSDNPTQPGQPSTAHLSWWVKAWRVLLSTSSTNSSVNSSPVTG